MKKLIATFVALTFLLIGGGVYGAKDDIICSCGCNVKAVLCGCPTAKGQLKGA